MEQTPKEKSPLRKVLDTLPNGHTVIRDAHNALVAKGSKRTKRALYEVVKGRSNNPELVEAILNAAEAAKTRAAELNARIEQLAQA